MATRSKDGRETWHRLREWDKGQAAAERLAGQILRAAGFSDIDPAHPLGGPDGLKDIVCNRKNKKWIGAAHFPRGQKPLGETKAKLVHDSKGIEANAASGIAFVTNQELTLEQRAELEKAVAPNELDLLHLERVASILDSPPCYGVRLEFLDIEMTKEEQLAFFSEVKTTITQMQVVLAKLTEGMNAKKGGKASDGKGIPVVTPQIVNTQSIGVLGLYEPRLRECKKCGAVYFVNNLDAIQQGTFNLIGTKIVTCPECGRSEKYSSWW